MVNQVARRLAVDFYIAAALLVLFGLAVPGQGDPSTRTGRVAIELALAVACVGAGAYLRTGTAQARQVGLAVAGITVVYGAYMLISQQYYVPGTIVAIFALFRLASLGAAFGAAQTPTPAPAQPPMPYGYGQPPGPNGYPQPPMPYGYGQPPGPNGFAQPQQYGQPQQTPGPYGYPPAPVPGETPLLPPPPPPMPPS